MANTALTLNQIAVLSSLQAADPRFGRLSGHVVPGKRAAWVKPRLQALARRGLVERSRDNVERWRITPAGREVVLPGSGGDHA